MRLCQYGQGRGVSISRTGVAEGVNDKPKGGSVVLSGVVSSCTPPVVDVFRSHDLLANMGGKYKPNRLGGGGIRMRQGGRRLR